MYAIRSYYGNNIKKHNISFEEAREVFDDPLHLAILDHPYIFIISLFLQYQDPAAQRSFDQLNL